MSRSLHPARSRLIVCSLVLASIVAKGARASEGVDLEANSAILARVDRTLSKFGLGQLHIGGGAALSLAMNARHGTPLKWHDIDIRAFPTGTLDRSQVQKAAEALAAGGVDHILPPGVIDFAAIDPKTGASTVYGHGVRMQTAGGLRFDLAVMRDAAAMRYSGFNSAENLFVPLRRGDDLRRILARLRRGSVAELVANGRIGEINGHAADVLAGRIVLTNPDALAAQPELSALRFLRGMEKLSTGGRAVDAPGLAWLSEKLPGLMKHAPAVTDPGYVPQVKEQASALLASGDARLLRHARAMSLDVPALARGELGRALGGHR
jgi:hypothetical protein